MKLKKINLSSAMFFGVLVLSFTFLRGLIMWYGSNYAPTFATQFGIPGGISFLEVVVMIPLVVGALYYVAILLAIAIYNKVAKKFPISWEIK